MPTTIDWGNRIIYPDRADMIQVQATPIEIYQLNVNDIHLELRDLEDDPAGMPHPSTHTYKGPTTLSGVTYARIMEIINDYTFTFLPNSAWVCQIVGGNSNIGDRVNPNNVSIQVANSAGLQDATSLQAASFQGHVTIDPINGTAGTTFPLGTQQNPVNNIVDAHDIAEERGLSRFLVANDLTLDATAVLADGYTFFAQKNGVVVTIQSAAVVTNCTFETIGVTGVLDSNNQFVSCEVFNASSLQASMINCGISGSLTLTGGLTQLINCHSDVAGGGPGQYPTMNMGGSGSDLLVRDYSGGLAIENCADANADVSIDVDSGRIIIDSTVTAGSITVRGIAEVTDNSTGTAVVSDQTITRNVVETRKLNGNKMITDPVAGTITVYDDDDITVLLQADLYEDAAAVTPYQGSGAERRERMT